MAEAARRRWFVEVDGTRLAWTRSGRSGRPAVVLAHGLTDAAATWERLVADLETAYDVVRFDARGHGESDRANDYSVEQNVADLVGLVTALDLDRPILVGHSMGAVHAALAAPRVDARAVVLEDPHWPEVPEDGSKDVAASRRSTVEVAALPAPKRCAYGRAEHPDWADVDLRAWVRAREQVDPDVVSWFGSWRTTNRWREHVAALSCPALLVTGDRSPTVTPRAAAQARSLSPSLRTVEVEGAGHDVRRDRFDPYRDAVVSFLHTTATERR